MEDPIENIRKDLLEEERQLSALEMALKEAQSSSTACQRLWDSDELLFVILQYLSDSFFILSTDLGKEEAVCAEERSSVGASPVKEDAVKDAIASEGTAQDYMAGDPLATQEQTADLPTNSINVEDGNNNVPIMGNSQQSPSFAAQKAQSKKSQEIKKVKTCLDLLTAISRGIKITEQFMKIQLDFYIYPFLTVSSSQSLKISALSLFSSLLRDSRTDGGTGVSSAANASSLFFERMKSSELLPLLLKIIDSETETCQSLALETLELVLSGTGLDYAVQTIDRFQAIDVVLNSFLKKAILLKKTGFLCTLLRIYCRLCDKGNVRTKLREKTPEGLDSLALLELCSTNEELSSLRNRLADMLL